MNMFVFEKKILLFQINKGVFLEKKGGGVLQPLEIGFSKDDTYPIDIRV